MVAVDSPDSFVANTPTANLIRQVLGAVSEFEKAMLVEKLRGARERKRRETGKKVGGRKNYAEIEAGPRRSRWRRNFGATRFAVGAARCATWRRRWPKPGTCPAPGRPTPQRRYREC